MTAAAASVSLYPFRQRTMWKGHGVLYVKKCRTGTDDRMLFACGKRAYLQVDADKVFPLPGFEHA